MPEKNPGATWYPGKVQRSTTITLTPDAHRFIARLAELGVTVSRSDLVEHAIRIMAGLPVNQQLGEQLAGAIEKLLDSGEWGCPAAWPVA